MSHAVAWNLAATEFLSAFTISENQHLTLRTFDPTKGADAVSTNADDLPQGPIVPGSSLAAINLLNWVSSLLCRCQSSLLTRRYRLESSDGSMEALTDLD